MAYNSAAVADSVIAFQKPITLQQGRALRDNPLAIQEGLAGAPKVLGQALGGVAVGLIRTTGTTTAAITGFANRPKLMVVDIRAVATASAVSLRAEFSNDNGSTWGAVQAIITLTSAQMLTATLRIDVETGVWSLLGGVTGSPPTIASATGTFTVPANVNGIRFGHNAAQGDSVLDVYILGGLA